MSCIIQSSILDPELEKEKKLVSLYSLYMYYSFDLSVDLHKAHKRNKLGIKVFLIPNKYFDTECIKLIC